jgi:hypoxanthine-guanine phosphoribosyltransferase
MPEAFYLSPDAIRAAVHKLADRLRADYPEGEFCVIAVLRGGMMLAVDLVRALHPLPLRLDVYPGTTMRLHGRRVVIVDDIIDSGATAQSLIAWARGEGAADVAICALLRRANAPPLEVRAYSAVTIESSEFVKGYGMDDGSGDAGRELPFVVGTGRVSERAPKAVRSNPLG